MFTGHGTGCGERILVADQVHSSRKILPADQGNISGNIDMGGTECPAGYSLAGIFHAAPVADVAFVFIRELPHALQDQVRRCRSHRAVRGFPDHHAQIVQLLHRGGISLSLNDPAHQPVRFQQSVPAGDTFPAGLIHGDLKQGPVQHKRTHPRRISAQPGAESTQDRIHPLVHIAFCSKYFHNTFPYLSFD